MEENKEEKIYYINVEDILPNRFQPRLAFDEKELNDLANSISKYGIIQPIVLRKIANKYEIIAGERRYKAACLAGLKSVPAIINNTDDNTSAEIALLENLQRKNLTVIEEAQSYKRLLDKGFTQEDIANKLGISQSSIANKMRLLNLPKEVKDALLYNKISERHARSLLSLNDSDLQKNLLDRIINEKLTVKQTEEEVSTLLMRNNEEKINSIPENIQRFLTPQDSFEKEDIIINPKDRPEDIEFLDMSIPNVVNIENENQNSLIEKNNNSMKETESFAENISPFQSEIEQSYNNYSTFESENIVDTNNVTVNNSNSNNLSKDTYNKIGEYINEIIKTNKSVKVSKIEMDNKYQITIEIEKY